MADALTPADVRIEPATAPDVPLILRLIKELAEYEKLSDAVIATEERLMATLFGDRPAAEVAIAYAGDQAVGYAMWFHTFSTFLAQRGLYLEDIYVRPEYRGRGIGRALLTHVAAVAVQRDCGRLEWVVLDWNEPAIRFYESLGARALDEWRTFRLTGEALARVGSSGDKS